MSDEAAASWIALGGIIIAVGALIQVILALRERTGHEDLWKGWPWAYGWWCVLFGASLNALGAGHFAGWY